MRLWGRPLEPVVVSLFDIEPFRIGGVEAFARELSLQLADRGWRSVLCFATPPIPAVRDYLKLPGVEIEVIRDPSTRNWRTIRDLHSVLRRYRPSIFHLYFTPFIAAYPWLARMNAVDRVFYTDQASRPVGWMPHRAPRWKRAVARAVVHPVNGLVAVSDYVQRCWAVSDLFPVARTMRIYNAVDVSINGTAELQASVFRKRYSIPPDRDLVVQVGWVIAQKGVKELLEAARLVVSKIPQAHFALVGDGAQRNEYLRLTASLGLEDHVTWTGLLVNPVLEGAYSAAQVVCQVSCWQEAFGWTIAEAMACGKPLVATRVGGIPELVNDGETGYIIQPGDTQAIAEKIILLLRDPSLRRKMGAAGRRAVEIHFDLRKNVAELLRVYGLNRDPGPASNPASS